MVSDAVEAWIVNVPTSEKPEQSDYEDFLMGATTIRGDIVKLSNINWHSIPQILPEQDLKKIEPLMQALRLMCSSATDSFVCF